MPQKILRRVYQLRLMAGKYPMNLCLCAKNRPKRLLNNQKFLFLQNL